MKEESISYWTVFAGTLVLVLLGLLLGPFVPAPLMPLFGIIFLIIAKKKNWMKDFKLLKDTSLMMLSLFIFIFIFSGLEIYALTSISWFKLIILGIVAEGFAIMGDFIPVVGDFLSAIINFFLFMYFVGGMTGILLGGLVGIISFAPLISSLALPIVLVAFKLFSSFIVEIVSGISIIKIIGGIF